MTTGAMVLGALPLALASGAGAESRQQIGWVIVGGMSFGTLLTLFVIPTVDSFLGKVHASRADRDRCTRRPFARRIELTARRLVLAISDLPIEANFGLWKSLTFAASDPEWPRAGLYGRRGGISLWSAPTKTQLVTNGCWPIHLK